jgi:hypothetical protein
MCVPVLAHQGGWDEALVVLVPIALIVGLLALATRRAKAIQAARASASPPDVDPGGPDPTELGDPAPPERVEP